MEQEYYVSIFAKFETDEEAQKFLVDHAVNHSIPKGGPVYSFSRGDEGKYRDLCDELLEALEEIILLTPEIDPYTDDNNSKQIHAAHAAIAKARGQS